nr:hypothetical protein PJ912_21680 [Pectobacterium colocasium]
MVLDHHESLPLIEQAQAPEGYVPRLKYLIEMDFNFMTGNQAKTPIRSTACLNSFPPPNFT